jgi:hypothetical protein
MMPRTTPSLEAMMPAISARGVPVVGPQTGASFVNQPPKREIFTLRASYQREAERAIRLQHSVACASSACCWPTTPSAATRASASTPR